MNRNQPVRLEEIAYYFDAVAQDRIDRGMLSAKHGEIISIKERLLALPTSEFQVVMTTVKSLIGEPRNQAGKDGKPSRSAASSLALYERAKEHSTSSVEAAARI